MGLIPRWGGFLCVASLGLEALGCGQVTGGNRGGGSDDPPSVQPSSTDDLALPTLTDRFAFGKSGDRLQLLGYVSEGVSQFRTLHDGLLDFDCEFVSASEGGDLQCVPQRSTALIFLDASCSEPATWVESGSLQVGQWLSTGVTFSDCPGQALPHRDTFQLGEEVYPETFGSPSQPVYESRDGKCVSANWPAKSLSAVNRLIARPESELVTAQLRTFDLGDGLRLSRLMGEDGSQLTVSVANASGEECSIAADDECLPSLVAAAAEGDYLIALDATCQTPAFHSVAPSQCGLPRVAVVGTSAESPRVHLLKPASELFARLPSLSEDGTVTGFCEPADTRVSAEWFALGRDLTGTFPKTRRTRQGTGVVHVDLFSSLPAAGRAGTPVARYPEGPEYLTDAGERCQVVSAADGTLRCVTLALGGAYESGYWADAACTERLYYASPDGGDPSRLRAVLQSDARTLAAVATIQVHQGALYIQGKGGCYPGQSSTVQFVLEQRMEVSTLPLVEETTL